MSHSRVLPVLSCPHRSYQQFRAGAQVRQVPGDVPRLHPTGQPIAPELLEAFQPSIEPVYFGTGWAFPGCLVELPRRAPSGARVWAWAQELNETYH